MSTITSNMMTMGTCMMPCPTSPLASSALATNTPNAIVATSTFCSLPAQAAPASLAVAGRRLTPFATKPEQPPTGASAVPSDMIGELLRAIEHARPDGIMVGGRIYANLDSPISLGSLLARPIGYLLWSIDPGARKSLSGVLFVAGIATGILGIFLSAFCAADPLFYRDLNINSILIVLSCTPPGACFPLSIYSFIMANVIEPIASFMAEAGTSRTAVALWQERLVQYAQRYAYNDSDKVRKEAWHQFQKTLRWRTDFIHEQAQAHYNYAAALGPRSLRRLMRLAERSLYGVHLLQELAKHHKGAEAVHDLNIRWKASDAASAHCTSRWLVQHGNRSVLHCLARHAEFDPACLNVLQGLVEHDAFAGAEELISPITINWDSEPLKRDDIHNIVTWLVQRGNRSVIAWLVKWSQGGNAAAKKILADLLAQEIQPSTTAAPKVRVSPTRAQNLRIAAPISSDDNEVLEDEVARSGTPLERHR